MASESDAPVAVELLPRRCLATLQRLAEAYGWRLADGGVLAQAVSRALEDETAPSDRLIEQTCCRLHFGQLFVALAEGGAAAERALAELFTIEWLAEGAEVRYRGYLFRSALTVLRRRLAAEQHPAAEIEQTAADSAARALTTVRDRFRDCRDRDAFWGWTARVAERATIDELRAGRLSGGRSVRAHSLDGADGRLIDVPAPDLGEDRRIDALAVRQELLRKCRLGKLSIDQREALVRGFWGGEKPAESAAALSAERGARVTPAHVSLWKHRGLQVMEANLRERGYE